MRTSAPARPSPGWYAGACFAAIAPVIFLALPAGAARVWFHVACLGATAVAAVVVHRSTAPNRRPWWFFVGGLALFSLRDLAMNWVDAGNPDPLVVAIDAVPMAVGYLLLCSATIALVRVRARGRDRDSLIDAAVVAASVATIVWISVASNPQGGIDYTITAAHAILQALLIALGVRFMFTGAGSLPPAWVLFGATFFGFIGNVGAVLATDNVEIAPHNWIAASWILAWCCVPLAAGHPRMAEIAAPAGQQATVSSARLLVLGAALVGTPVVVLWQVGATAVGLTAGLGSVLVTVLGLVRVVRLVRALERVRRQQQAVVQLSQLALSGAAVPDLVAAASAAITEGLHAAKVEIALDGPESQPTATSVHRELRVASERLGAVLVTPDRVLTAEDQTFIDAVASTLSTSIARARAEGRVRHWAMHDPLTSLANRMLFAERLESAYVHARRTGLPIALLFIDIDGFKRVNDVLGHQAGDQVLIETARRLRGAVRGDDFLARLAGDEFVVLCAGVARVSDVQEVADRLLAVLRQVDRPSGVRVSASIGVAFSDGTGSTADLLRAADDAMYAAKRAGRDRVVFGTSLAPGDGRLRHA